MHERRRELLVLSHVLHLATLETKVMHDSYQRTHPVGTTVGKVMRLFHKYHGFHGSGRAGRKDACNRRNIEWPREFQLSEEYTRADERRENDRWDSHEFKLQALVI